MTSKTRPSKKVSRKKSARRKQKDIIIDGPTRKMRPVKATVYLTEDHAFNTALLTAASSLNGRKYNRCSIIEEALELWFENADLPNEYHLRLKLE